MVVLALNGNSFITTGLKEGDGVRRVSAIVLGRFRDGETAYKNTMTFLSRLNDRYLCIVDHYEGYVI